MGTERHGKARPGADVRERQQELLRSLHAAVDALTLCVARIEDLIGQVDRQVTGGGEAFPTHPPAQVSFGGGASVIGSRDQGSLRPARESSTGGRASLAADPSLGFRASSAGSGERRRGTDRRTDIDERRTASDRRFARHIEPPAPGTPALMAATEMAHLGYTREEIAERLRERWGDRAAAILREALD